MNNSSQNSFIRYQDQQYYNEFTRTYDDENNSNNNNNEDYKESNIFESYIQ